jgi:asparagine synthase (glutamine-hydrolysing)
MCGICGVVCLELPADSDSVRAMMEQLRHRGPDGDGSFAGPGVALGHTRLAIIDLSDGGLQPFASDDGELQLLHNGEIFNYLELRARLEGLGHRFRSATDTEVVLRAYEEWGPRCVERFNGMWAFALWDGRQRRLFCSRDRFGIKPFAYTFDGRRLAFASEPRALLRDPSVVARPNLRAVRDFLAQGHTDHLEGTFYDGIRQLPPAHSLLLDARGLRLERHWRLEPASRPADAVAATRELFLDSIRLRLRSDVPLGTALSGGLDSSAVAVAIDHLLRTEAENARPVGDRQRTFTVYFEDGGYDERPYAQAVVGQILAEPRWISFGDEELVDVLPRVAADQGEPFGSTSIVAQWFVMREAARAGLKVMLDGQGGDEVLAGYRTTYGYRLADLLASADVRGLAREVRAFPESPRALPQALVTPFLPEGVRWRLRGRRGGGDRLIHPGIRQSTRPPRTPEGGPFPDRLRSQYHVILAQLGLPELLRYEDRNSMAHSVEGRVPFLDHRLVELVYGIDAGALYQAGVTKRLLRRALGDLLPAPVRDRTDKLGFVTPESRFFQGALGAFAEDVFRSKEFRERGLVDSGEALRRLDARRNGTAGGFELWRALSVELWARTCLDGPP